MPSDTDAATGGTSRPDSRPHVVWFVCDQLRADALGFMGNPCVRTPHLDRLAETGVVFDHMIVQAPVCMASRACMLTGRYMRSIRMSGGSPLLDPRETTLPEILQRAGYATGMFGKLHLTPQQYTFNELGSNRPISNAGAFVEAAGIGPMPDDPAKRNYGFQEVVGFEDLLWGEYADWVAERDPTLAAILPTRGMGPWQGWRQDERFADANLGDVGPTVIPPALHPSVFIGTSAAEFFTRRHADGPCFMEVSFVDPHHPWDPPEAIARTYAPDDMPLPQYTDSGEVSWPPSLAERTGDWHAITPDMARTVVAYYYAMVEMIDRAVGHVVEAIDQAGQLDNTLFVFCADHGELLGRSGLWRKGAYHYDDMIRVPCFVSWPSRIGGARRVDGLVQEIDLAPTILGLVGEPVDHGMQGIDLSDALVSSTDIGRPWAYTESYLAQWGPYVNCWTVRTSCAKLNYYPTDRVGHLFDLGSDPDERRNLFDRSSGRGALRDEMMAHLIEELHTQADPLPKVLSQF